MAAGVGVGVEGEVEENIRRKTFHLVYNGDMKADTNSLVGLCVEQSELGW